MHIIVGVDESASGEAALRWALRVAALAGASVEAVRSWVYSPVPSRQLLPADEMDRLAEAGL
ncbi:MAG: universal stress protein, partial [Acidimicrobiia bacterium]|nr:universal stress protein [Acidimicrobiia bacterium]